MPRKGSRKTPVKRKAAHLKASFTRWARRQSAARRKSRTRQSRPLRRGRKIRRSLKK